MTATRRRRAQRGDGELLREQIITATRGLLAVAGHSDAVSIRKVADAVGVTPPSIYLHFVDKAALLEAVVGSVFAELDAAMLAAAVGIDDPLAVLCAYGQAYVDFAVEHPEHYRLATMERHDGGEQMSKLDTVLSESAFSHMLDAVQACINDGLYPHGEAIPMAMQLWTSAHGLASLMITKPFLPWGDRRDFVTGVLSAVALGLAVIDRNGGEITPDEGTAWIRSLP